MFRYSTGLKGLIIDVDSFDDFDVFCWKELRQNYKCIFLTFSSDTERAIKIQSDVAVYLVDSYKRCFAPNKMIHDVILKELKLKTSEVAYVSRDYDFLYYALYFFSGTIWITDRVNYEEASTAPDLICDNVETLDRFLKDGITGFCGETMIYPNEIHKGIILCVDFELDGTIVPLYMLGRYFGNKHYMNQLHPYSVAIYRNKNGRASGVFDKDFSALYYNTIKKIQQITHIDAVCSVPERPEKGRRFEHILESISEECHIENISLNFKCLKSYPEQKGMSGSEREENVKGAFCYNGDLSGKTIVIIDDIISTGATIRECIRELNKASVNQIFVVALAVNQIKGSYWSSNVPYIKCPRCGGKMFLLVNSSNHSFFYMCNRCNKTIDFNEGWESLKNQIDN